MDKVIKQRKAGPPSRRSGKEKEDARVMAKARVKEKKRKGRVERVLQLLRQGHGPGDLDQAAR